jgi:hypothetical protein
MINQSGYFQKEKNVASINLRKGEKKIIHSLSIMAGRWITSDYAHKFTNAPCTVKKVEI